MELLVLFFICLGINIQFVSLILYVVSWCYGVFECVFMSVNVICDWTPGRISVLIKLMGTLINEILSN